MILPFLRSSVEITMKHLITSTLVSLSFLGTSALHAASIPVTTFTDLKNRFLNAESILVVLEFSKCSTVSQKNILGLNLPQPEEGTVLGISFSTQDAVLVSNSDVESLTIPYNENMISIPKLNSTISGPTLKVTGNLQISNNQNVIYFLTASYPNNTSESIATYQCDWNALKIRSQD